MTPLRPGATLGVFGSGQLGRMFALAARSMGYRVAVYSPDEHTPAGAAADVEFVGSYHDEGRLAEFCRAVGAVTFEFENVPATVANVAERFVPVRPAGAVLEICQHRLREKEALTRAGLPVPSFVAVRSLAELTHAVDQIGRPGVLKTASSGYDGKGQLKIEQSTPLAPAWTTLQTTEAIYEAFISFDRELSVIGARDATGEVRLFGPIENRHDRHILDLSIFPATVSATVGEAARQIARTVLAALDVVGVLCVEMFLTNDGDLLINELAPRPHNSGHLTIEACETSQFAQQARITAGLPLGGIDSLRPAAMANLLGDLWAKGEPRWEAALALPGVSLHLYGKEEPQPGRKMGHLTALAATTGAATERVLAARNALLSPPS